MKEVLIQKMKDVFGRDNKRIEHALAVLKYAEQIQSVVGGDEYVITAAAILHDIGIQQAERKYGSTAGKFQETEGPVIAEPILKDSGFQPDKIKHVCGIIANHHTARDTAIVGTVEFGVIWDADWLVNIPDECGKMSKEQLRKFVERIFRTKEGRKLAEQIYLRSD